MDLKSKQLSNSLRRGDVKEILNQVWKDREISSWKPDLPGRSGCL